MKFNQTLQMAREESFDILNPDVLASTLSSEIRLIASPDGKSHIRIFADSKKAVNLADLVEIEAKGNKLTVRASKKSQFFWSLGDGGLHGISIELALPHDANLKIKTVSGDVEINQALVNLEIDSISSEVSVNKNPSESCSVKTVSGDIAAHAFSGCEYKLKSISGNIKVHVAPDLAVEVDGNSLSGELNSEIPLNENSHDSSGSGKVVEINVSTISGDFNLVRN
jgi:hypothetical protein